ncbi:hypothetical protein GOEFS_121_00590 [Gordonia effusa NBRC 100432]|uniref:Uncharacterized protein n=1 Tax=Gordonia effusa NBRC 100432 TaxID=1077974 RepID=H0R6F6_9ACTN|nr:hypothetical protein [Gordonia effusa]GAB20657.1 hypothetical protein GOEFS_121_00590 [Gordonia effusa NBRC 100432]
MTTQKFIRTSTMAALAAVAVAGAGFTATTTASAAPKSCVGYQSNLNSINSEIYMHNARSASINRADGAQLNSYWGEAASLESRQNSAAAGLRHCYAQSGKKSKHIDTPYIYR